MKSKIKAALLTATLPLWIIPAVFCIGFYLLYKAILEFIEGRK
jgi:hypothetical protein